MAASNPGFDSQDGRGCLSTDDVLAHLDRRLEGQRLQDVRDHLDACSACRMVMAEAARIATGSAAAPRAPRTLADGEIVADRYEIRRFVARGGMGEVYEAFDSALAETIALKTITVTAIDQADAVKRLLAEVRIARKVTHPNVCRILEFGTHQRTGSADAPIPFLTMPLLQGETLARRIERSGRLRAPEGLRILTELAAGLAAVHEVGVVHRDFKSDNVFLVRGPEGSERAVVMDFGLARALETQADKDRSTGRVLIGTPAYMAPEQVEGKPITKAVDVYAFGVVAFEVLTGRVPFVGQSAAAVALARLQREAAPPSSSVGDLDRAWDVFIQRCLRRAPEQRYASMTALAGALDRLRGPQPSGRRARAAAVAVALAGVALAARTVVTGSRSRAPEPPVAISVKSTSSAAAAPPRPPATRADLAPKTPPPSQPAHLRSNKHGRPGLRAKLDLGPPTSSASPAPVTPAKSPESAPSMVTPFAHPSASRPRQPDDLVDPF